MAHGELEVFCGPMFAGKSSVVVRMASMAAHAEGLNTLVIKPAYDTRYGETRVTTHDGKWVPALAVNSWPDIPDDTETVVIDEIQFFQPPYFDGDIVSEVRKLLAGGKSVVACGLDADWQGNPFPVTASLLAMADHVTKMRAICAVCGKRNATKNYKLVRNDLIVELGHADLYQARCPEHWTAG